MLLARMRALFCGETWVESEASKSSPAPAFIVSSLHHGDLSRARRLQLSQICKGVTEHEKHVALPRETGEPAAA